MKHWYRVCVCILCETLCCYQYLALVFASVKLFCYQHDEKLHVLSENDEIVIRTAKKLGDAGMKKHCHPPLLPDILLYIEETVCSCAKLGFVGTAGSTIAENIELMRKYGVCSSQGTVQL